MELELWRSSPVLAWKWTVKVSSSPRGMAARGSLEGVWRAGLVLKRRYDTGTTWEHQQGGDQSSSRGHVMLRVRVMDKQWRCGSESMGITVVNDGYFSVGSSHVTNRYSL